MPAKFILCLNRQGKVRFSKFFCNYSNSGKQEIISEIYKVLNIHSKSKNFNNFLKIDKDLQIVFKKYNGLYFIVCIDNDDNRLKYLHFIPLFVEILDKYFENVNELDLIYNFYKLYSILDSIFINGELIQTDREAILASIK